MDKYLEHLITKFLENDNGKMESYYKNEVNKKGLTREASIYRWCLGPSKQDELREVLRTGQMISGKKYITLASIRYEIRHNNGCNIELSGIFGTLKLVETDDGLNLNGSFEVFSNESDFICDLNKVISSTAGTPQQSAACFVDKLNEIISCIKKGNNEELNTYKTKIEELLE